MAFWKPKSSLFQSGQVIEYTPAGRISRDDGGLQKGLPFIYEILTTGQFAGTTNITVNGKTDVHSNNCVYERQTGLVFSRYVSASVGPLSDGKLYFDDTAVNNEDMFKYCDEANLAGLAGFSDWRVSNITEIFALINWEAPDMLPNATAFPSFPASDINTSTTDPKLSSKFMQWRFGFQYCFPNVKTTATGYCLLVRGG